MLPNTRPTLKLSPFREMQRLFEEFTPWSAGELRQTPLVNVAENDQNFIVTAELPGLAPDQLELSVLGNALTIRGSYPDATAGEVSYRKRERSTGSFSRTLELPSTLDGDKIDASLVNGVLTVTLTKAGAAQPRQISIQTQ